ncbi:hypothetical protein TNCV_5018861 [Trichonephila clavipes]|nr:hypothetical protein TNCV_5018861 [Trichonephila clavipes]
MATGSYLTPIYSRSQSEIQGDLHNFLDSISIVDSFREIKQIIDQCGIQHIFLRQIQKPSLKASWWSSLISVRETITGLSPHKAHWWSLSSSLAARLSPPSDQAASPSRVSERVKNSLHQGVGVMRENVESVEIYLSHRRTS